MALHGDFIRYDIGVVTTEDPNYPATSLIEAGEGWVSEKFPDPPQELGLLFPEGMVNITQVQVTAFQTKIPRKVDFYVGQNLNEPGVQGYRTASWKYLGYVLMDNNTKTNFRAVEVKTVTLNTAGQYLKLLLHECHLNKGNLCQQVGIKRLAVYGHRSQQQHQPAPKPVASTNAPPKKKKMDLQVAGVIAMLAHAKSSATEAKDENEVSRLDALISDLRKVEEEKQQKMLEERQREITSPYMHPRSSPIPFYPETEQHPPQAPSSKFNNLSIDPNAEVSPPGSNYHSPHSPHSPGGSARASPVNNSPGTIAPLNNEGSVLRSPRMESLTNSPVLPGRPSPLGAPPSFHAADGEQQYQQGNAYENRVIPTLGNKNPNAIDFSQEPATPEDHVAADEQVVQRYPQLVEVLGEEVVVDMYSDMSKWSTKENALATVAAMLENGELGVERLGDVKVYFELVNKGMRDKVANVFLRSLDLLKVLTDALRETTHHDVRGHTESLTTFLLTKFGDANMRTRETSIDAVLAFADIEIVGPASVVHALMTDLETTNKTWRRVNSSLSGLLDLIPKYGLNHASGMSLKNVMEVTTPLLDHSNSQVRTTAVDVVTEVYKLVGRNVARHLENVRPQIAQVLHARFKEHNEEREHTGGAESPELIDYPDPVEIMEEDATADNIAELEAMRNELKAAVAAAEGQN